MIVVKLYLFIVSCNFASTFNVRINKKISAIPHFSSSTEKKTLFKKLDDFLANPVTYFEEKPDKFDINIVLDSESYQLNETRKRNKNLLKAILNFSLFIAKYIARTLYIIIISSIVSVFTYTFIFVKNSTSTIIQKSFSAGINLIGFTTKEIFNLMTRSTKSKSVKMNEDVNKSKT